MKTKILIAMLIPLSFLIGFLLSNRINISNNENYALKKVQKPLEMYTIENLMNADIPVGTLRDIETLTENETYISNVFEFRFIPGINDNIYKTTTGVINYPKKTDGLKYPIVILIRGYVDQQNYSSGTGTKNIGLYLVNNGFVTIAPDFLGYANSDSEAGNIFEARFQTYTTILSLIESIENGVLDDHWDGKNLFIWGHSNGGQIALETLEITRKNYATVLWAPVSKPFPYSILYYTDDSDDKGKLIRLELSRFESLYDVEKFSLSNYLDNISADIELHQGTNDDAVPSRWSDSLSKKLKSLGVNVSYISHYGADHNMRPDWDSAAKQSLLFYQKHLK